MIVKVCGQRGPDNIRAVEQTGSGLDGIYLFPPFQPSCLSPSGLPAGAMQACRRICQ